MDRLGNELLFSFRIHQLEGSTTKDVEITQIINYHSRACARYSISIL